MCFQSNRVDLTWLSNSEVVEPRQMGKQRFWHDWVGYTVFAFADLNFVTETTCQFMFLYQYAG